ncbi:TonB-dependent receptor plug domain-containing protein [Sphingomonas sp. MMS24-JH45]
MPITVTAFNAASIAALSAETIGDLDTFTPGLTINDSSVTQPSFTIRGVQTDDFGMEPTWSVGIFVDGIYSGRSGSSPTSNRYRPCRGAEGAAGDAVRPQHVGGRDLDRHQPAR